MATITQISKTEFDALTRKFNTDSFGTHSNNFYTCLQVKGLINSHMELTSFGIEAVQYAERIALLNEMV